MAEREPTGWAAAIARRRDAVQRRLRQLAERLARRMPRTWSFAAALVRNWQQHRAGGLAAEVAFWAMVSIFPGLLALTAMLGFLDGVAGGQVAEQAEEEVLGFLRDVLTERADTIIDAVQGLFAQSRPGVLTTAVALALWAASRGFAAVIRALDVAYELPEHRGWLHQRLVALGLAVGSVVVVAFLLAMMVVGPLLGSGQSVADSLGLGEAFATVWDWLRWPAVLTVALTWATTVFHVAPNQRTPWRWDVPGAVVTAAAWIVVSVGFRVYLDTAGAGNEVFGVLGGAIITMVWLYLLAVGLLLGGEVNGLMATRRRQDAPHERRPGDEPRAHQNGGR